MSTLHAIKFGGDVQKYRSVSTGTFSPSGHDSSYKMSAKKAVLLGTHFRPQINQYAIKLPSLSRSLTFLLFITTVCKENRHELKDTTIFVV